MSNSLLFKIKADVAIDKYRLLELFFKDWVDNNCNNEVNYKIERKPVAAWVQGLGAVYAPTGLSSSETFRVDFEKQEDLLAMKLKGVPEELQHYLEIVI